MWFSVTDGVVWAARKLEPSQVPTHALTSWPVAPSTPAPERVHLCLIIGGGWMGKRPVYWTLLKMAVTLFDYPLE